MRELIGAAAMIVLAAASAEAQYSRPVFAYVNTCNQNARATLPGGSRTTAAAYTTGAVRVDPNASGRLTVTGPGQFNSGAGDMSIDLRTSALLHVFENTTTCRYTLRGMSTPDIVNWAQEQAALHEGFRRRDATIRNVLWLGAVGVFAGTLAAGFTEVNGQPEGDTVLLLSGTALAITMGYLGGQSATDAVDERSRRDRYRRFEEQVKAAAR